MTTRKCPKCGTANEYTEITNQDGSETAEGSICQTCMWWDFPTDMLPGNIAEMQSTTEPMEALRDAHEGGIELAEKILKDGGRWEQQEGRDYIWKLYNSWGEVEMRVYLHTRMVEKVSR